MRYDTINCLSRSNHKQAKYVIAIIGSELIGKSRVGQRNDGKESDGDRRTKIKYRYLGTLLLLLRLNAIAIEL